MPTFVDRKYHFHCEISGSRGFSDFGNAVPALRQEYERTRCYSEDSMRRGEMSTEKQRRSGKHGRICGAEYISVSWHGLHSSIGPAMSHGNVCLQ